MLEHSAIVEMNRKGFLNACSQPEHFGIDVYGDEILSGDDYVEYDGELILMDNLHRYLAEQMEFEFKTAI